MHTHISEKTSSDLSEFLTRSQEEQLVEAREKLRQLSRLVLPPSETLVFILHGQING
ncbi:MAG: hypothetical protein Ct9H300mP6_02160 [Gammaproteobacteria bacterium]|nr:MAG: hypothetical protein Ct9H300mP6_02160 [Gammaproteobacteria bacterium]